MSSNLIRWGGLAALFAGILYAAQSIVNLVAPQRPVFNSLTDYSIEILFAAALAGTLGAIAGLHVAQRDSYGRLGALGSLTAFIGHALLLASATATALTGGNVLETAFFAGFLAAVVGLILLGAATLRAGALPRWCGVLLIVGFPMSVALEAYGGAIVLGAVWVLVGYAMISDASESSRHPARVS